MGAPFDFSKVRKDRNKRLGLRGGFSDPITWIDTGNYALNKMISGDFKNGVPLGAVTVFAGESGSGKSYIVSGNIVRDALAQGCEVVLMDSENALYESWMKNLGVDVNHPRLTKEVVSTIDHVAEVIRDYTDFYIAQHKNTPREEQPKVLFVIDSLGVLQTQAEIEQFDRNELKGDKGIKAKTLKMLVANCIRLFAGYELGLVATNHTYKSQNMYDPDDVISGGNGFIFAASIIVSMNKRKLKEDEFGNKITEVAGIRAKIKCVKSRFAKPFEEVEVQIPYDRGMDAYSGLFDLFETTSFTKEGNRYKYVSLDGTEHKLFRKAMTHDFYDLVMSEFAERERLDKIAKKESPFVEEAEDAAETEIEHVE